MQLCTGAEGLLWPSMASAIPKPRPKIFFSPPAAFRPPPAPQPPLRRGRTPTPPRPGVSIPVVDLSLPAPLAAAEAARSWGFFHLVNHHRALGVPEEHPALALAAVRAFNELPAAERAAPCPAGSPTPPTSTCFGPPPRAGATPSR